MNIEQFSRKSDALQVIKQVQWINYNPAEDSLEASIKIPKEYPTESVDFKTAISTSRTMHLNHKVTSIEYTGQTLL